MARIPPPFTHPVWPWQIYQKRLPLHISPLQHFCPYSGFQPSSDWIHPFWHIQSAKAAVGRLAVWLPPQSMLAEDSFTFKNYTYTHICTDICVQTSMTAHILIGTVCMTVTFDQWFGFVMIAVVCPLVIWLMYFIHSSQISTNNEKNN